MKFLAALLSLLFATAAFAGDDVMSEWSHSTLISSQSTVKAGSSFKAGVLLVAKPGWHTYWENPGDAGIATNFKWKLPDGVKAGGIEWPVPEVIREETLVVYGYHNTILLPVTIDVPADYSADSLPLNLQASWLICATICIPETADLSITLPVGKNAVASDQSAQFVQADARLPKPYEKTLQYGVSDDTLMIAVPGNVRKTAFLPRAENVLDYTASPTVSHEGGQTILNFKRAKNGDAPDTLTGYLTLDDKTVDITAKKGAPLSQGAASTIANLPFLVTLIFALLGGLTLNLMPCVLPVLSLKALAIAKKSSRQKHEVVLQAFAYTAGVLASFALIGGLLISLQQAGEVIGWGYQMQSPVFVGALTILLFSVGLNLAGMFEVPVLFGNALQDTKEHHLRGSFLTGVLATAVATPCTAPFMATAVGATLSLSPVLALLVFLAIGVGLALPFLLIALFPALLKYLPKPGAWMMTFKQFLAFPMFASAIWLLWVLTMQVGASGLLVMLITLLLITFLVWIKGRCTDASIFCRSAIVILVFAALIQGLVTISKLPTGNALKSQHEAFSEERIETLRKQGKAVFVDATAAWCLTCQVNARVAIHTQASKEAFEDTNTVLMIADWTNRDENITRFLKRFGYNGVPLYVYFPITGEPVVLPQLLSESLIISTLKGDTHDQ